MRSTRRTHLDHAISTRAKLWTIAAPALLFVIPELVAPAIAFAQAAVSGDDPRECARIATDAERLACYDHAFRAARPDTESSPRVREPAVRPAPRSTVAPSPAAPASAPTAGRAGPADDRAQAEPETVVVIAVHDRQGSNVTFVTDGGEVWIQTDGRRNYYPDPPFRAELRPGAMSSYFLAPADRGRAVRVRRRE